MNEEKKATITPYYCQNPECAKQIVPSKWKHQPRHCNRVCQQRHQAILRGQCKRPGCGNYLPPHRHAYCSPECYALAVVVPRKPCKRPGCPNVAAQRAHATYCSKACRDASLDLAELSRRGQAVIAAHKAATGHGPKYAQRSAATSRNNRLAPPKRRMRRTGTAYGHAVVFEPEGHGYRATVPEVAGIIARGKTKKEAMSAVKIMMRQAGETKRK